MAQLPNQFRQSPLKGMVDLRVGGAIVQAQMDVTAGANIVPGTAVTMIDSAGGVPKVKEVAADSDEIWGFLCYDQIKAAFNPYDPVTVALVNGGAAMWMEASAAIARNAVVGVVVTGSKVKTSAGGSRDVGRAYDKAAVDTDLIKVILLPKTTTT